METIDPRLGARKPAPQSFLRSLCERFSRPPTQGPSEAVPIVNSGGPGGESKEGQGRSPAQSLDVSFPLGASLDFPIDWWQQLRVVALLWHCCEDRRSIGGGSQPWLSTDREGLREGLGRGGL